MAPRRRNGGEGAESQAVHTLGVRGRKTGAVLPNNGEKDEHGFLPLDNVFSSPHKGPASANGDEDDSDAGSEEMELEDPSNAGPGPRTLLKNQRNLQYPIPRSRSPAKIGMTSPARRNPRLSSPMEEDRDATVTRKLDFAGKPRRPGGPNGANGAVIEEEEEEEEEDEEEEVAESEIEPEEEEDIPRDAEDDGMDMVENEPESAQDGGDSDNEEEEEEEEEEPVVQAQAPAKGRGRPKKAPVQPEEEEVEQPPSSQKKRGRPPKKGKQPAFEAPQLDPPSGTRKRRSLGDSTGDNEQIEDTAEEEPRQPKRQKTKTAISEPSKPVKKAATAAKSEPAKPRGRPGRKPKQADDGEDAGETSFAALQKGPPMPKRRGLVSVKRPDEILQTRSGRHSFKPLHWWAGEQVITEEEEQNDMFTNDRDFVVRSMKEIRRVEEEDTRPARRAYRQKGRGKASKPRLPEVEEGPELEEWEINPGTVTSEIIAWEPEYETHPPADDEEVHISMEQIAISGDAVATREIRDATFKFGKTLTMPFMGAGIVDLPPGSEKRPKNSRKMHMVFFVHQGKVKVTVNEDDFRISAGGQWFVPRGNYYSIANDYEQPARIFFSQACEVASQNAEASQLMAA